MIKFLFNKKKSSKLSLDFETFLNTKLGIKPLNEDLYLEAITHMVKALSLEKKENDNLVTIKAQDAFIINDDGSYQHGTQISRKQINNPGHIHFRSEWN